MTSPRTISKPRSRTRPARRHCLCCATAFASRGIHNRICPSCARMAAASDTDSYRLVTD